MKKIKFFLVTAILAVALSPSILFAQQAAQTQDNVAPSDVENVKVLAGDAEVTLTWDVATDNASVTGYKIYYGTASVTEDGSTYEFPPILVEDVVTHTVTELENAKTYYFSITAMDAARNESVNYSTEVSATPQEGLRNTALEDDGKAPEVTKAEAKAADMVKVEFTEPVILPIEDPEKTFVIKKKAAAEADQIPLEAKEAELDPEDELGKTVILLTEAQQAGVEYEVTVGIETEDHFGNPVIKDQNDKTTFVGFGEVAQEASQPTEPEAPKDEEAPKVTEVKVPVSNQVQVVFSESVTFGKNAKDHFSVEKKDTGEKLNVVNVSLSTDGKTAFVNTDAQQMGIYALRVSGVTDGAGNEIDTAVLEFEGKGSGLEDLVPPEDVTELIAKFAKGKKFAIELAWKKSKNSAGDLADQNLYQSENQGQAYGTEKSLGKEREKTMVENLPGGKEYMFKVTSKDEVGNESQGSMVSIFLPETGPALPVAIAISLLAGYLRKKRKLG